MAYAYSMKARAGAGIVAGMIAGVVMAMVAMFRAGSSGLGFLLPLKLIAALFWGVPALIGGVGVLIVGLLIHMVVSGGGGMMFGLMVGNRFNAGAALVGGVIWGIVIWAINWWVFLPWLNQVMLDRQMVMPTQWFVLHLIYGAMLFLVPSMTRAFGGAGEPRTDASLRT